MKVTRMIPATRTLARQMTADRMAWCLLPTRLFLMRLFLMRLFLMRLFLTGLFLTGLFLHCPCAGAADDVPFHAGSVVRFASRAEAIAALTHRDRFLNHLSRFDRQSRLGVAGEPTLDQLTAHIEAQVLDWTPEEVQKVTRIFASVRQHLDGLKVPLPPTVLLAKTTGRDESNAAYCRGKAIVFPQSYLERPDRDFERIAIHELFHIVSNHAPDAVQKLYPIIGFEAVSPIELPPALRERKITNPDAPSVNCVVKLTVDGKTLMATPILYSKSENFDPTKGSSFFPYLKFQLMVVEKQDDGWQARLNDDQPTLLEPRELPDFERQIGRNTKYILHPEEILADNFVHLVLATPGLPNPEIVEQLGAALK